MTFCRHFIKELFKASGKSAAETSPVMHSGDLQRSSPVPESGGDTQFPPGKVQIWFIMWSRYPSQAAGQPARRHLPRRLCGPPAIAVIPTWLEAGQQGPFSFNPKCLPFREVFKAEWKAPRGNGGVAEPRSVSSAARLFLGYRWGCPLSTWGDSQSFSWSRSHCLSGRLDPGRGTCENQPVSAWIRGTTNRCLSQISQ